MEKDEISLEDCVRRAMADETFPGIVCGVWKDGREVFSLVEGFAVPPGDPDYAPCPMERGTVFDMASLTKALSTAILVMRAVDSRALALDDEVSRFFPSAGDSGTGSAGALGDSPRGSLPAGWLPAGTIPIRALLTHTSGLPAIPALQNFFPDPFSIDRDDAVARLLGIAPERVLGQSVVYSCMGFMLLGLILERVSGLSLGELFRRELAAPLGLKSTGFAPKRRPGSAGTDAGPIPYPGAAPTEYCAWRKRRMRGQVHDESSWCLGGGAGNAGLFACLDDVAAIASIYLGEGVARGAAGRDVAILSPGSVALMTRVQTSAPGERRSLGLRLHDADSLDGPAWPASSFGHTGFTGTSVYMDPESGLKAVTLTNRVYYGRDSTAPKMSAFRRAFHTAIMRDFGG
jgi:CubicO group peptidase (beta-lactamase class C family)